MAKKRKKASGTGRKKNGRATKKTAKGGTKSPRTTGSREAEYVRVPVMAETAVTHDMAENEAAASKPVAVNLAVTRRLEAERRWPPYDMTKTMGNDYRYNGQTMNNFLYAVHQILAAGAPVYTFQYDAPFVNAALGLNAPALMAAINVRTV